MSSSSTETLLELRVTSYELLGYESLSHCLIAQANHASLGHPRSVLYKDLNLYPALSQHLHLNYSPVIFWPLGANKYMDK